MRSTARDAFDKWCPLLWWVLSFFFILIMGDAVYRLASGTDVHSMFIIGGAAAVAAIVLEVLLLCGWTCSLVPGVVYGRWLMYFLSAVIGVLLLSTISARVPAYYMAVAFSLLVVPVVSLLVLHSTREHMDRKDNAGSRVLAVLSEWPVYLFIVVGFCLAVVLVFGRRVSSP